jgi:TRAP transporter 4TM/12TM fusion protein
MHPGGPARSEIALVALAALLAAMVLYTSATIPWHPTIQRGLFLAIVIVAGIILHPLSKRWRVVDLALGAAALVAIGYLVLNWEALAYRSAFEPAPHEYLLGLCVLVAVLEVTRRAVGLPLVLVAVAAILYALFGRALPDPFTHKGYSAARLLTAQYLTHEGLFGSLLGVAAGLVAMYVLFGCVLQHVGVADFFMRLANRVSGRAHGGPAKLAVSASALMGTISGSSTANVVTTGTTTIPLMIRTGYTRPFAAATEAVASMGGQITPPIMGVAAFLMAELTGIPYITIAIGAVLPAALFYLSIWLEVDFEARRLGLRNAEPEARSGAAPSLLRELHLLLPVGVLVWLLLALYSPAKAAFYALVVLLVVAAPRLPRLLASAQIRAMFLSFLGAAVTVGLACATAGIVVGALNLTGASLQFSYIMVDLAGDSQALLMLLVMVLCILLGMGLPTPAAYAVAASFAAPMLTTVGISALAAHLFVLYYASLSSITPPVAIAAYAAAGIAGCSPGRAALMATRLGLAAFIVPFLFAGHPALLIGQAPWLDTLLAAVTAVVGVGALAAAIIGYLRAPLGVIVRALLVVAGLLLIVPSLVASVGGLAVTGLALLLHRLMDRDAPSARGPAITAGPASGGKTWE